MVGASLDIMLRAARAQAGLSQGELAARAGVTRQAVSAIESGKVAPTMAVALRLARVLGCRVDDLFRLVDELPSVGAELVGDAPSGDGPVRVQVADVGGRLIARPLAGAAGAQLTLPRANGIARPAPAGTGSAHRRHGRAGGADGRTTRIDLFVDPELLAQTVVAVGCDPATGLLADHLRRRHPTMELAWGGGSSQVALETVARGEAHLAGTHLLDPETGEYNRPVARRLLGEDVRLVTFARWEQGLMVAAGNPKGIVHVGDLARAGLRIANREPGSGARALLDAELARAGLQPDHVTGHDRVVHSHLAAAEAVAAGLADAAVGVRAAAQALGLGFVPLASERYDLAIPARHFELPAVQALLETLTSPLFRIEVEALGGYDVTPMGSLVAAA
ncbi:MAG: helix-turn-helix domain-containing protein [Chloroflexota bacterium]|nr:helix-turn-helix domain-containing protein [Chloroflexota bacterium]